MPAMIALLRAVNVGGIVLAMKDLSAICSSLGYRSVRTYIASGNVVFAADEPEPVVKRDLEAALTAHLGRSADVMVRTAEEMAAVSSANPFPDVDAKRVLALFFDAPVTAEFCGRIRHVRTELLEARGRELFIHYPDGIGPSKLALPGTPPATGRNLNTVARLAAMAAAAA